MFECGLEGISLKGVKNSEAVPKSNDKEETISVTICNEVASHRASSPNLASETCESDRDTTIMCPLQSKDDITTTAIGDGVPPATTLPQPTIVEPDAVDGAGSSKGMGNELMKTGGAASVSCVIEFKVMWYNFAAPPQTPITRKIDYTRLVG